MQFSELSEQIDERPLAEGVLNGCMEGNRRHFLRELGDPFSLKIHSLSIIRNNILLKILIMFFFQNKPTFTIQKSIFSYANFVPCKNNLDLSEISKPHL